MKIEISRPVQCTGLLFFYTTLSILWFYFQYRQRNLMDVNLAKHRLRIHQHSLMLCFRFYCIFPINMRFKINLNSKNSSFSESIIKNDGFKVVTYQSINSQDVIQIAPLSKNQYNFYEVPTFKRYMLKFHDNLTFSSQVTVVLVAPLF